MILLFFTSLAVALYADNKDAASSDAISLEVKAKETTKVPLLIAVTSKDSDTQANYFAQLLKNACEFTGEIQVSVKKLPLPTQKKELTKLAQEGFLLVVYVKYNNDAHTMEWRLYDTGDAEMIIGKSHKIDDERGAAYRAADALWPILSGQQGFFSTKIAYCVKADPMITNGHTYKHIKHIYICDYDGSNAQCIVDRPTLNIGPRWGCNPEYPTLYYSRCTASNMQLIEINSDGHQRVVLNRDGLNMLPSFSPSGNGVAYNCEGNIIVKRYDPDLKKVIYKKITQNDGNNVSPNLLDNGDVIFCSDFKTKSPQIFYYHADTNSTEALTHEGHCCCPAYSQPKELMVYTKLVSGVSQLFLYDFKKKEHKQLTFEGGHKDEPSFSPCGNFLLFSQENGAKSRIAMIHLTTKDRKYVSPADKHATFGSWSRCYTVLPSFPPA